VNEWKKCSTELQPNKEMMAGQFHRKIDSVDISTYQWKDNKAVWYACSLHVSEIQLFQGNKTVDPTFLFPALLLLIITNTQV
jgi:hypothetical protein